jgi:hypothetical protein
MFKVYSLSQVNNYSSWHIMSSILRQFFLSDSDSEKCSKDGKTVQRRKIKEVMQFTAVDSSLLKVFH